jgi:hypothetical protein
MNQPVRKPACGLRTTAAGGLRTTAVGGLRTIAVGDEESDDALSGDELAWRAPEPDTSARLSVLPALERWSTRGTGVGGLYRSTHPKSLALRYLSAGISTHSRAFPSLNADLSMCTAVPRRSVATVNRSFTRCLVFTLLLRQVAWPYGRSSL